jgi:tRNA modification GTPase
MKESIKDTIVAMGTRPGESAIGIIKLSGNDSIKITDKIFVAKKKKKLKQAEPYSMAYGVIKDPEGGIIDEVLVSVMKAPGSYTREDVVEINCHGGIQSAKRIMELVLEYGARLAEPGEFTKRAFLNGRIDLSQAEAVIDMVQSKTRQSLKIAANNLKGNIKEEVHRLKDEILEIIVQLEAAVDFIEEDLHITPYNELLRKTGEVLKEIEQLIKDEEKGEIIKNGVRVAIVGKPNVGKSSLLNFLSKKEKAIVTEIPGTTRDAIEEIIYVEGIPLILVDTAGIRKPEDKIEKIGVERSIKHIEDAELVIIVLDGSREFDELDSGIIKKLEKKNVICCINKKDMKQKMDIKNIEAHFPTDNIISISALKGQGVEKLQDKIRNLVLHDEASLGDRVIINARQKEILNKVKDAIGKARISMEKGLSEEFPCSDLRIAYDLLGEITGDTTSEDVLNKIFERFCIGK